MKKVYLLIHTYEFCDSIETKFLGIYSTRKKAEEAKARFLPLKGFNKYPESCFDISSFFLDEDSRSWSYGFVDSHEIYDEFVELTSIINEIAGIEKSPEDSWDDQNYYDVLCSISELSYKTDDVTEIADHIKKMFFWYMEPKIDYDVCIKAAERIIHFLQDK
ncbi:MAG: hypothetical protein HDT39_05585 [Lachnospiraceae bacterium]|nr:hypothetical protein [Lachnospiraceae bacterium]